jgi:hypothetical protein
MAYSNDIPNSYPNKFIVGKYTYDKATHKTSAPNPEDIDSDTEDEQNVPYNYNEAYDLHYFLTSLLDLYISQELFDWIMQIYPQELIPEEETSTYSTHTEDSDTSSDSDTSIHKATGKAPSTKTAKATGTRLATATVTTAVTKTATAIATGTVTAIATGTRLSTATETLLSPRFT